MESSSKASQAEVASKFLADFKEDRSRFDEFCDYIEHTLRQVLRQYSVEQLGRPANSTVAAIEARVKTLGSLSEKIDRKAYTDPEAQCTDLVGLRIITYRLEDVTRIASMVAKAFELDEERSEDQLGERLINQFGYSSVHLIVRLTEERLSLPECLGFRGLVAEIQVRSVLQHAWATISHELSYRPDQRLPRELERELALMAALLEAADQSFTRIREQSALVRVAAEPQSTVDVSGVSPATGVGQPLVVPDQTTPLSTTALRQALESPHVSAWYVAAKNLGFEAATTVAQYDNERLDDVVEALTVLGIRSIEELDRRLDLESERKQARLASFAVALQNHGASFRLTRLDSLAAAVLLAHQAWKDSPESKLLLRLFESRIVLALQDA